MVEIRRITEPEAEIVTALWDDMCQEPADGGPLQSQGRRNIAAQMHGSASHPDEFCLVAIEDERVLGFVKGLTTRQPLLPGVAGEIEALYVVPAARGQGTSAQLAAAAVKHLRAAGAGTIQTDVCIDDKAAHTFWKQAGFSADTLRFWNYAPPIDGSSCSGHLGRSTLLQSLPGGSRVTTPAVDDDVFNATCRTNARVSRRSQR